MIDKIRKLLALASDPGAAPNEAETAARHAAALMAKHNIDQSDLTAVELDLTTIRAQGHRPGKKNATVTPPWIGIMAFGIAQFAGVRVSGAGGWVDFKGPRDDSELAKWMLETMIDRAYAASKGQENPNAFRNGYAIQIQRRLKEMVRQRDSEIRQATGGSELVVASRETALEAAYGPQRSSKAHCKSSGAGHAAGQKAALPVNKPVAAAGATRRLT